MSVEKTDGASVLFICDDCGEILDTDTEDYDEARGILKHERWKTMRFQIHDGDWVEHYCPACKDQPL